MRTVALYGNSLALSSIAASLEGRPGLRVVPARELGGLEPDAVIVDLAAPRSEFDIAVWKAQPRVLVIGVDLGSNRMFVLSGQPTRVLTFENLYKAIETLPQEHGDIMTSKNKKYLWLTAAATVAAALIVYASLGWPPVSRKNVQGAIGQRDVYRQAQLTDQDVGVAGQVKVTVDDVKHVLESPEFKTMSKDGQFQKMLANGGAAAVNNLAVYARNGAQSQAQANQLCVYAQANQAQANNIVRFAQTNQANVTAAQANQLVSYAQANQAQANQIAVWAQANQMAFYAQANEFMRDQAQANQGQANQFMRWAQANQAQANQLLNLAQAVQAGASAAHVNEFVRFALTNQAQANNMFRLAQTNQLLSLAQANQMALFSHASQAAFNALANNAQMSAALAAAAGSQALQSLAASGALSQATMAGAAQNSVMQSARF